MPFTFCPDLVASFCIRACIKIKILLASVSAFKMSVAEEEVEDLRRGFVQTALFMLSIPRTSVTVGYR